MMSTNEHGLDYKYFERWINRVLPTINRYSPEELSRVLSRMAYAADSRECTSEIGRLTSVNTIAKSFSEGKIKTVKCALCKSEFKSRIDRGGDKYCSKVCKEAYGL